MRTAGGSLSARAVRTQSALTVPLICMEGHCRQSAGHHALLTHLDSRIGAVVATLLFAGGKYLITLYVGPSNIASSFGAAGALIVLLLWIFYSSQIFLLGAEFTRAWATVYGSHRSQGPTD